MESVVSEPTSVAQSMRQTAGLSYNSPAYKEIVDAVSYEVSRKVEDAQERADRATPVVVTQVLDAELASELSREFPEFRLVNYGMDKLGHERYQAFASMMNELMLSHASRFAKDVVHLGGSLLSSLTVKDVKVHLEMDPNNVKAVHERMRDTRVTCRVMGDYATLMKEGDFAHARKNYDEYLNRSSYTMCTKYECRARADVYCVDAARYAVGPTQVVMGAIQCGASVAYAFIPYHPTMLLEDVGEIPGTGVFYEKDFEKGELRLRYPEGVCGAQIFSLANWAAWLVEHVVRVGRGAQQVEYHMQLLKRRGPFMMVQIVKAAVTTKEVQLRHALDLELSEPSYIVRGWKLKNLAVSPDSADSWTPVCFMAPRKVVDAVTAFGMQLPPESFSRYAIRRQYTMYDRVTIEGSTVIRGYRPTAEQLDVLTTMTYADLFVRRYESGMLSKELMARLKSVAGFANAGTWMRVKAVACWCVVNLWQASFGRVLDGVASLCMWLSDKLSTRVSHMPEFRLAPERLDFETLAAGWRRDTRAQYREAVASVTGVSHDSIRQIRGGLLARQVAILEGVAPGPRSGAEVLACVHVGHVKYDDSSQSKTENGTSATAEQEELVSAIREINETDQPGDFRHTMPTTSYVRVDDPDDGYVKEDQDEDPDFIGTMNEVYAEFNPELVTQDLTVDIASISHDPQDRQLFADKLRLPRLMSGPKDKQYFMSKIRALGTPKRQETAAELLSATNARNMAAPQVRLPQDDSVIIPEIWSCFLDRMCEGAREKLERYRADPVGFEETAYKDWMSQAKPNVIRQVQRDIMHESRPMKMLDVGRYLIMLKADVKPPLSSKPVTSRIEPQTIVYHDKVTSSMYSSIFRVLVRRFLSLLKPNVHVNLLKDMDDVRGFVQGVHPFGSKLKYVENDFSKYDKSQDEFVFKLEQYIFKQLGMNEEFMNLWLKGHENCSLFSFTTGLSLHLRYQRKSGDATTSFGNVMLNIVSVSYAYALSDFAWALFMGDDSLVATACDAIDNRAVDVLSEVFNLSAKTFISDQPYFASWFFVIWDERRKVIGLPDPVKRIEKWSQAISGDDPQWDERYIGAKQTCKGYAYKANTRWLGSMVAARYGISVQSANRLPAAIYTAVKTKENFRSLHEDEPRFLRY